MKVKRKLFILFLGLLLLLPLSVVLGQSDNDTLIVWTGGDVITWNPVLFQSGSSFKSSQLLWPRLYEQDPMTGQPVPGLTSWEISEDGLTYTFTILEDAVWSDGTPISSNDFKFVIEGVQSDLVDTPRKSNVALIDSISILDDKHFEVKLKNVNCTFWQDLSFFRFLPAHRFAPDFSDFMTNEINTNPDISGGPYLLVEWQKDEFTRFVANPLYWKGDPQIRNVITKVIADPPIVNQSLITGEIDYATMSADQFEQIGNLDNLNYYVFPEDQIAFFELNWTDPSDPQPAYDADGNLVDQPPHPIFSDVRVRKAFAMGYNRDDILAALGENGGSLLVGSVNPAISWAYNNELPQYTYDPDAAGALLDEAGWVMNDATGIREKDGVPLKFDIAYSPFTEFYETMAIVAQDQLGQLGMDITLTSLEWSAFLTDVWSAQKFDVAVISFIGIGPDPSTLATVIEASINDAAGAYNASSVVNAEIDRLLEEGKSVPSCSTEERAPFYYELQRIEHENVMHDYVFTPNIYHVTTKRVGNFNPGPWWGLLGYGADIHAFTLDGS